MVVLSAIEDSTAESIPFAFLWELFMLYLLSRFHFSHSRTSRHAKLLILVIFGYTSVTAYILPKLPSAGNPTPGTPTTLTLAAPPKDPVGGAPASFCSAPAGFGVFIVSLNAPPSGPSKGPPIGRFPSFGAPVCPGIGFPHFGGPPKVVLLAFVVAVVFVGLGDDERLVVGTPVGAM